MFTIYYSQVIGSYEVAKETAVILRQAVSMSKWRDADALIDIIRDLGGRLASAQPKGLLQNRIKRKNMTRATQCTLLIT